MIARRQFLRAFSGSFAGLALTDLMAKDGILSGQHHHPPRAKRVVQLFMAGAASHVGGGQGWARGDGHTKRVAVARPGGEHPVELRFCRW